MGPGYYQAPMQLAANANPVVDRMLGALRVTVEGETIYLGNQTVAATLPTDYLAIRIDRPVELKNLVNELGKLPLEQVRSVELLPTEDHGWRGLLELPDGRTVELVLDRVSM